MVSNIHALLSILLLTVCSQIHAEKSAAAESLFPQRSDVQALAPAGMPVTIDSVTISEVDKGCKVTYQLTNKSHERLKTVRVYLDIYDATTLQHRRFEDVDSVDVAPFSRVERTEHHTGCLREDERGVIVVWEAESERSVWKVDHPKLAVAIEKCLRGKPYSLPKASWWVVVEK